MKSTVSGDLSGRATFHANRKALLAFLLVGIFGACASGVIRSARAATPARTTMDGVFTAEQAARGKAVYNASCSVCHMEDLSGSGQALPLAGDDFMGVWEGQSLGDLFDLVRGTMPQDKPGSLTPEATVDLITYLLQFNQFPAGKDELTADPDALKAILITKKPATKQ